MKANQSWHNRVAVDGQLTILSPQRSRDGNVGLEAGTALRLILTEKFLAEVRGMPQTMYIKSDIASRASAAGCRDTRAPSSCLPRSHVSWKDRAANRRDEKS